MTILDRLLRVVPTAVVLALPAWFLSRNDEDDCVDLGQCFGLTLDGAFYVLVLGWPILWLVLRGLGVPRSFLTATVGVGLAWCSWFTALGVQHGLDPAGYGEQRGTIGLLPALLAAGAGAAVATVVVGPGSGGGRAWALRIGLPLALVALNPVATAFEYQRYEQHRIDEVAAVPVTTYQPRIRGVVAGGYATGEAVRLHYSLGDGAEYQFVTVRLLPAEPGRDLCSLVVSPTADLECSSDGETMRAVDLGSADVAVVRGDTVLHAETYQPDLASPEQILDALRTAPEVTPRTLVTTGS